MSQELSIDDIRDRIVSTEKVAHVTFYIVKDAVKEDCYRVYSESKGKALRLVIPVSDGFESDSFEYLNSRSLDDAWVILSEEAQRLEEVLARKRDGVPTQKQVYFLFHNKIPIPIDLTWGGASDLIDEHLARLAKEKQTRRLERFNGFTEGDRVSFSWGRETIIGCITRLYQAGSAGRFALIKVGKAEDEEYSSMYRVHSFNTMRKVDHEQ